MGSIKPKKLTIRDISKLAAMPGLDEERRTISVSKQVVGDRHRNVTIS